MGNLTISGKIEAIRAKGERERWWIKVIKADADALARALGVNEKNFVEIDLNIGEDSYVSRVRKARDYVWIEALRHPDGEMAYLKNILINSNFNEGAKLNIIICGKSINLESI